MSSLWSQQCHFIEEGTGLPSLNTDPVLGWGESGYCPPLLSLSQGVWETPSWGVLALPPVPQTFVLGLHLDPAWDGQTAEWL